MEAERKLSAIFASDVVGFSKMMANDEHKTLELLHNRREVIDSLIDNNGGKVFGSAGDSLIAEFASPIKATECAVQMQNQMSALNEGIPENDKMVFRVGINVGDVMATKDNLFGDAVNVAARLEAAAKPGGICLSKTMFEMINQKVQISFEDAGHLELKNIPQPVQAYFVILGLESSRYLKYAEAPQAKIDEAEPGSLAVMLFKNLSNDEEQEYFADGITEDIIANLSLWKTFPVISRNSSFSFKNTTEKLDVISKALGARYLVEGSVRKAGNKVRITAQLTSADDDKQIWSKRWDRSLEDIFEVQDEVSRDVAALISPALKDQEQVKLSTKGKKNFGAWDEYLQGLNIYNTQDFVGTTLGDKVIEHCKRAIELDANFCDAYVLYCNVLQGKIYSHEHQDKREENTKLFHQMAQKAVDTDPENPDAMSSLSMSYSIKKDLNKRLETAEKALELNPSHPRSNFSYGQALTNFGRNEEALSYVNKAIELDPQSKRNYEGFFPLLYIALKDWENAITWLNTAHERSPHSRYFGWKAAVYGKMNDLDSAKENLNSFLKERPEIKTLEDYEKVAPTIIKDTLLEGLKIAGLN